MGRLSEIEEIVAGTLPPHNNLKMIFRGRPRYVDSQLNGGGIRFAQRRGAQFTSLMPDNCGDLVQDAPKASYQLYMESRPSWIGSGCLIRVGTSENVGELHIVRDLINPAGLETVAPLLLAYSSDVAEDRVNGVYLLGTPCTIFLTSGVPNRIMLVQSWYPIVPGDSLLMSATPAILPSLSEWVVKRASFIGTSPGSGVEPPVVYKYEIEVETKTGLLPVVPAEGDTLYLKALPLYWRKNFREVGGDVVVSNDLGPFLIDLFHGSMLITAETRTLMGLKTWDAFGEQPNLVDITNSQQWQTIGSGNYLVLERPIRSDSLLFWQRIAGNFQYQKRGYFQAELDSKGEFTISSDLLVPPWPTDKQRGWVIPIFSRAAVRVIVQWEPQAQQIFEVPGNVLTFIRPKIYPTTDGTLCTRLLLSFKGSPSSRVEIRDWEFDGPTVQSISYFILGQGDVWGEERWMAGGFCFKPLFYNIDVLRARYSDGVSRYNAGYIYS